MSEQLDSKPSEAEQKIQTIIPKNILFREIDEADIQQLLPKLSYKATLKNQHVFKQGDKVDGVYLIISGKVQSYVQLSDQQYSLSHASTGHLFGEFLQVGQSIRSINALAMEDTELAFLSLEDFQELFSSIETSMTTIATRITNRLLWNQTTQALSLSHLFTNLDESIIRKLINEMQIISIPSNKVLIEQGTIPNELYIVVHGRFQIIKNFLKSPTIEESKKTLGVIGRGEAIGEKGVILKTQRNTEVRAIRDSTVARLTQESFEKILREHPVEINQAFVSSLVDSFKSDSQNRINSAETFTVVSLSDKISGTEIAQQIANTLITYGNTSVLSSQKVDQIFNQGNISQKPFEEGSKDELLQWLSEQEIAHKHVIYVADNDLSQWTSRCIRQTDHILFVSDAQSDTELTSFETSILNEVGSKDVKYTLLLMHNADVSVPSNTAAWLDKRHVDIHHHLRKNNQQDLSRVARFLTNNAISLVLGGGGARGFAHAGVIKALKELDIPIDMIGGNSMGAIMAAQFAMQWQSQKMVDKTVDFCLAGDALTLPIVSLFSGKKMTAGLRKMYQDVQIEDLWYHFFSISCNISRATTMTHKSGPLVDAVLKSNTPPGLLPPQVQDGDIQVDGALLNNLPIDIMKEMNPRGTIIAVDVNAREDLLDNTENAGGISGWSLLLNKLNPMATHKFSLPTMPEILGRASVIGGLAQRKKNMVGIADVYLEPPVNSFSMVGYKHGQKIADTGYTYAIEALKQWSNRNS